MPNDLNLLKACGLSSCLPAQLADLAYSVIVQRCVGQILERFTKELPRDCDAVLRRGQLAWAAMWPARGSSQVMELHLSFH